MNRNKFKIFERVIALSKSDDWDEIKKEWKIININYLAKDSPGECICGKYPIREEIILFNNYTNQEISVGNCCIKRFFNIKEFSKVFNAVKKNKVNAFMIRDCFKKSLISSWEYNFMMNVWRKRCFTEKQLNIYNKLNKKIMGNYMDKQQLEKLEDKKKTNNYVKDNYESQYEDYLNNEEGVEEFEEMIKDYLKKEAKNNG